MTPDPIRVLLVDDHAVVREGIRLVLAAHKDVDVVGEAPDGHIAIEMVGSLKPDVVVMDIGMPTVDGIEATGILKRSHPGVRVLILTVEEDDEYLIRVLKAGAAGFVPKSAAGVDLVNAIRSVHQSGAYIHPSRTKALLDEYSRSGGARSSDSGGLTARELEILGHIASGLTSQAIADKLFLSAKTVQAHRANLMAKLGIHNAAGLVRYAMQRGIGAH